MDDMPEKEVEVTRPPAPSLRSEWGLYPMRIRLRGVLRRVPGLVHLTPNHLSLLAFLPGSMAAWSLFNNEWGGAAIAIACRLILQALDGLVAEDFGKKTHLGAYLNRLPGEISDLLMVLALFPHAPLLGFIPLGLLLPVLIGWVQLFGLLGLLGGGTVQNAGPCGQFDRLVIILIACLLCLFLDTEQVWAWTINLICMGAVITILVRIQRSVGELEAMDTPPDVPDAFPE